MTSCFDRNNLEVPQKFRKVFEFGGGEWKADEAGRLYRHGIHLLRLDDLRTLREPGLCGQLPHRRHAEGSGDGHRQQRQGEVHRLHDL